MGEITVSTPRDRNSSFYPLFIKKSETILAQSVADRIIGPYTFGDSTRKISDWMEGSLGNCVSADILSGFTGLAYVDIMLLHPHHIGRTADGRRCIRINRKKTNVEAFIPLHPIAEQILDLYNTTDDTKPVFPLPSRDEMWFEIHELGVAIGREENLSYHQSRHSFGTFLISEGIPIESIAKMMGHSGIRTTQRYAEVTDKKISKDMDNLMAFRRAYGTGASREKKTKDALTDKEE